MTEEQPELEPGKIWTPPESLDTNTQRMAWTMFLEWWKGCMVDQRDWEVVGNQAAQVYDKCLRCAKMVRQCELDAGGS